MFKRSNGAVPRPYGNSENGLLTHLGGIKDSLPPGEDAV